MATKLHRNKGEQFFDGNGNPLVGGKFKYERAGTSTLLPTYSNQAGTTPNTQTDNRIILNGDGRLDEPIYIDDSFDAKETLYNSADVIIDPWPFDNIPKAVDPTSGLSDFAKPLTAWSTDTDSTVSLTTSNLGSGRLADTSSNSITYNLPSASAAGNGKGIVIKKTAAANTVTIDGDGSETIDGAGTFSFSARGAIKIASDGANWRVEHEILPGTFLSDLTAETDVGDGDLFLLNLAAGGYRKVTSSNMPGQIIGILEHQESQNTGGGTVTSGSDETRPLNTEVYDRLGILSVSSNQFTISQAGSYLVYWESQNWLTGLFQSFLYNVSDSTEVARGTSEQADQYTQNSSDHKHSGRSTGFVNITIDGSKTFEIRNRAADGETTDGFGLPSNFGTEVYARVVIYNG